MKVKLITSNYPPTKGYPTDAGFDLYSPVDVLVPAFSHKQIKLGISIEINQGEVALVQERSSKAIKHGLFTIGNVIDSGYRGEISCVVYNGSESPYSIAAGEKICQLLILKLGDQEYQVVQELTQGDRGVNAYGSTGN